MKRERVRVELKTDLRILLSLRPRARQNDAARLCGVGNSSGHENGSDPVKYWEIIADRLSKAGWSLGWVSAVDCEGRTIWIVDAHRDDGRRFIVRADEKLSAFIELERQVLTETFYLESIHADSRR